MKLITAHLAGSNTRAAAGITATGNARVLKLCRRLVKTGHDPATPMRVYRGAHGALDWRRRPAHGAGINEGRSATLCPSQWRCSLAH
jgi:hypothetical protein